jgi:hypothetical protein
MMVYMSAHIVVAQEDSLFGPGVGASENRDQESDKPQPTRPVDDIFGDPPPGRPTTTAPRASKPAQAVPAGEVDVFGPPPGHAHPPASTVTGTTQGQFCKCNGEADLGTIARIEKALGNSLGSDGLEFVETPLEEVVSYLEERYALPLQIDTAALEEIGVSPQELVTIRLPNISVQSALRLLLRRLALTYVIESEVLMITTLDEAESQIQVCVYDVRDLIDANPPVPLKELTDVIRSSIQPASWTNNGNRSVRSYPPNLLVIAQTRPAHDQIRELLETMQQMRQGADERAKLPQPAK